MAPVRPRTKPKARPGDVVMQMGEGPDKIIRKRNLDPEPEKTKAEAIQEMRRSPQFQKDVSRDLSSRLLVRDESQRQFEEFKQSQEKPPDFSLHAESFFDELKTPPPVQRYAVDQIAKDGHVISMPSPRKTGKTTLLANLGFAGLTGTDFLGQFATDLRPDEGLAVINAEMLKFDNREPWEASDPGKGPLGYAYPYKRLHFMHCRETGTKINLLHDATRDGLAEWLIDRNVRWLFLDPWKEFITWARIKNPNDDGPINELLDAIRDLARLAGLTLTVIPAHTPQSAEAGIRAKGSGAFEDGADGMWSYYKVGKNKNRSSVRVFGAEGRFPGIDPTEVLFDREHHSLSLGSRTAESILSDERDEDRELRSLRTGTDKIKIRTSDEIYRILDEPMTPSAIAEKIGADAKAVSMALGRSKGKRFMQAGDGTWRRI